MIRMLPKRYDVSEAVDQIAANPSAWNRHIDRLSKTGPHRDADDIWVRFNPIENMGPDFFSEPHYSDWYAVADELPAVKLLAEQVYDDFGGTTLGGVIVTRVPAGKMVFPHTDKGWHAEYYEKIAVQLAGNESQAFCFENESLSPVTGQAYTFDNSHLHWVTNDSSEDRITLIVCLRRDGVLSHEEHIPFDMYFASLASMQVHPGAGSKEHRKMTLEECRDMAIEMIEIRREVTSQKEN